MAADIVSDVLLSVQQQEEVVLMDDYGTVVYVFVPVAMLSSRTQAISSAQTQMVTNQTALEAYAAATSLSLATPLTLAEKIARWQASQAAPTGNSVTASQPAR